jgi:alkylation response protein AidB-like acyl-CoA dehydrogenase
LQALSLPRQVGGEGVDALTWGMVLQQIGYHCKDSALPLIINHQVDIARLVCETNRVDLIEKYAVRGAGFAYSENTDAFSFRTVLHRKGDGYVLSGYKSYVTGGQLSDVFLTYPLDDTGDLQACLVESNDPGVTVTRPSRWECGRRVRRPSHLTMFHCPLTGYSSRVTGSPTPSGSWATSDCGSPAPHWAAPRLSTG